MDNIYKKFFKADILTLKVILIAIILAFACRLENETIANFIVLIMFVLAGVKSLIKFFKEKNDVYLVYGISAFLIGIYAFFSSLLVIITFIFQLLFLFMASILGISRDINIINSIIGLAIIINSFYKMSVLIKLKKSSSDSWKIPLFISLFTLTYGLLLIISPLNTEVSAISIIIITVIIYSLINIFLKQIVFRDLGKKNKKQKKV